MNTTIDYRQPAKTLTTAVAGDIVEGIGQYQIVRRGIVLKREANRLADQWRGDVWKDGRKWAVVQRLRDGRPCVCDSCPWEGIESEALPAKHDNPESELSAAACPSCGNPVYSLLGKAS